MFENIKAKFLEINRNEYNLLEKWKWSQYCYWIILRIFKTNTYSQLSNEYKEKFYQTLNSILDMELDLFTLKDTIESLERFFQDNSIILNDNFYYYLDILLDYPLFPLVRSKLFLISRENNDKNLLLYLRIYAKLYHIDDDFIYYFEEFEDIVLNNKLSKLNLLDVIINGIINANLSRTILINDINNLLEKEEDYTLIILKLFQAPSDKYYNLVSFLLADDEILNSGHLLEMIDIIYQTPIENLKQLEFKITHKLVYEVMSFESACKNYHEEAMKILDEGNNIKSYSMVRVPIYKRR